MGMFEAEGELQPYQTVTIYITGDSTVHAFYTKPEVEPNSTLLDKSVVVLKFWPKGESIRNTPRLEMVKFTGSVGDFMQSVMAAYLSDPKTEMSILNNIFENEEGETDAT